MAKDVEFKQDQLTDIANFITTQQLEVQQWQTTMKESISRKRSEQLVDDLEGHFNKLVTEDEKKLKYSFQDTRFSDQFNVLYNVIVPKQKQYEPEIVVVIKGSIWSQEIEEFYKNTVTTIENLYFSDSMKKFACLTTAGNDIISGDYFLSTLTEHFKVQQTKTQFDTVKKSTHKKIIYGYTPLWAHKISVNNFPMNLQVAVTDNGSDYPTYTIGTPILINEY